MPKSNENARCRVSEVDKWETEEGDTYTISFAMDGMGAADGVCVGDGLVGVC